MVTTVVLHGDLDLVTVEALRELLDDAVVGEPPRLVIDIADVPFVDVVSLSSILATTDAVRERAAWRSCAGRRPPYDGSAACSTPRTCWHWTFRCNDASPAEPTARTGSPHESGEPRWAWSVPVTDHTVPWTPEDDERLLDGRYRLGDRPSACPTGRFIVFTNKMLTTPATSTPARAIRLALRPFALVNPRKNCLPYCTPTA